MIILRGSRIFLSKTIAPDNSARHTGIILAQEDRTAVQLSKINYLQLMLDQSVESNYESWT
jgi:hypothetical protein